MTVQFSYILRSKESCLFCIVLVAKDTVQCSALYQSHDAHIHKQITFYSRRRDICLLNTSIRVAYYEAC